MDFGLPELIIILLIVLLLFGSARLPKLSRSVGDAMREFRDGLTGKEQPPEAKKPEPEAKKPEPEAKKPEDKEKSEIKV